MKNRRIVQLLVMTIDENLYAVGDRGVILIENNTVEFDNSIEFIYTIHFKDGTMTVVENLPVIVSYSKEERNSEKS